MSCKCNSLLKKRSYCLPDILSRDYIYIMKRQEGGPVKDASGIFWQKMKITRASFLNIIMENYNKKNYQNLLILIALLFPMLKLISHCEKVDNC